MPASPLAHSPALFAPNQVPTPEHFEFLSVRPTLPRRVLLW